MKTLIALCALTIVIAGVPAILPMQAVAADDGLLKQMDIGLFSIGGRATWFDPHDGQSRWFGGGQVRVYPFKYLAFEGSPIIGGRIWMGHASIPILCKFLH
jgi:hypothetical protein